MNVTVFTVMRRSSFVSTEEILGLVSWRFPVILIISHQLTHIHSVIRC